MGHLTSRRERTKRSIGLRASARLSSSCFSSARRWASARRLSFLASSKVTAIATKVATARAKVPIAVHAAQPVALRPKCLTVGSYDRQRPKARNRPQVAYDRLLQRKGAFK